MGQTPDNLFQKPRSKNELIFYFRFLTNNYYFFVFFRECAELLFDLQTVPGRYFFELLSKFTSDEQEQEKFIEFTTSEVKILNTKVDSNIFSQHQ